MSAFAWIGLGVLAVLVAGIAEAVFRKRKSRPLASIRPGPTPDPRDEKPSLGMEETDIEKFMAAVRANDRAAQTTNSLLHGTDSLRKTRWIKRNR